MSKLILILLLLPILVFSQNTPATSVLFKSSDTIFATGTPDTIKYRMWIKSKPGAWITCTETVTATEKAEETSQVISLADESTWYWGEYVELLIYNKTDSAKGGLFYVGNKQGAVTAIIIPDSIGVDTLIYNNSVIGGN